MITFASCLWDTNEHSEEFSRAYDETWAEKLFRGFRRHTRHENRCVLYVDRERELPGFIEQVVKPDLGKVGYGSMIEPFEMNVPMILVGLDTMFIENIDKFCRWCLENPGKLAMPKHPYQDVSINGVVMWGGGDPSIHADWNGENDMEWLRRFPHERTDELWPGKILSYRAHVHHRRLEKRPRIIYFHGRMKPPELLHYPLIRDNWR